MEGNKKLNRGTKFTWFAWLIFVLEFIFVFIFAMLFSPFDGSDSKYSQNAEFLTAIIFIPCFVTIVLFLLFRLFTCGFKKANKVYRINKISMILLLISFLVMLGLTIPTFLPMMLKFEQDVINGTNSCSNCTEGHGFLALFTGYNDYLVYIELASPIIVLILYVLMYVLMVKSAREVRMQIKQAKEEKRNAKMAKKQAIKEEKAQLKAKKDEEHKALVEQKALEKENLRMQKQQERIKKEEEAKILKEQRLNELNALKEKKEEERRIKQEEKLALQLQKEQEKIEKCKNDTIVLESTCSNNEENEIEEYLKRKTVLKKSYIGYLVTIIPMFILLIIYIPGYLDPDDIFQVLLLLMTIICVIANLVFIIKGLINSKKMTLVLRIMNFSLLGVQLIGLIIGMLSSLEYGRGLNYTLPIMIFFSLYLILLIVTIILLKKFKNNDKIKNYISFGSIGLLLVLAGVLSLLLSSSLLLINSGLVSSKYNDFGEKNLTGVIVLFVFTLIGVALMVTFSKRLSEGYCQSKTLEPLKNKPFALMSSEEQIKVLNKEYKVALKDNNQEKANQLNTQIMELSKANASKGKSDFDGKLLQLIAYRIAGNIITMITFGVGYPWAKCFVENWETKHKVIDGKRLSFNGKGIQLFVKYIIWFILTWITFGIYGLWLSIKMKKWSVSHTHIKGSKNDCNNDDDEDDEESDSKFDGRLIQLIGYNILFILIVVFTMGIGYPWAVCLKQKWEAKHTIIDGRRMYFDGNGAQLFGKYIIWLLLTFITFGIYVLWLHIKMIKWVTYHTHFEGEIVNENVVSEEPIKEETTSIGMDEAIKEVTSIANVKKIDTWTCPNCGLENDGKFCEECGYKKETKITWTCSKCGKEGNKGKFCKECGSPKEE